MTMTFDGGTVRSVEKTGWCAKEEVSSSLLGKLGPPFICYKHIPSNLPYTVHYNTLQWNRWIEPHGLPQHHVQVLQILCSLIQRNILKHTSKN